MLYFVASQSTARPLKPRIFVNSSGELESAFHELIPISRAMGVKVVAYQGNRLTITAPLALNYNHRKSAFGGSLYAVAVLAGWGLMQLKLGERMLDCNTVVAGAEASYLRPVYEDLTCSAELPADSERLFDQLATEGGASTKVASRFILSGETAMEVIGAYRIQRRTGDSP